MAGIAAIKQGYIVGPLSNGNTSLLLDMAKAAGLPWDLILGSDVSRAYKPDPEAYLRPAALLGLEPGEVMLAAAHESDLAAAREAGLATAFTARPLEHACGCRCGRGLGVRRPGRVAANTVTVRDGKRFAEPLALPRSCPPYVRDQWISRTHDRILWWPAPSARTCIRCRSGGMFSQVSTA